MMKAAAVTRFGGPAVLKLIDLPVPQLDENEVLIAVHTAGVGSWDADIRAGWSSTGPRKKLPLVLGTDGSGTIVAVGSRVRRFSVGDRVYAYSFENPKGGFYAEFVAVEMDKVAPKPRRLSMREAGAAATTGLTALQGIDDTLGLNRDERIIVHGASGGVGSLAVQFAKRRGARVFATASGKAGAALARRLGADEAVDGKRSDITAAALEFAEEGIDAVLAVTGDNVTQCLDALHRGGRVAYPNGVEPAPRKRKGIKLSNYDGTPGVREFERLDRATAESKLKVPIAASFPLARAADAHRRLAKGHILGKIVLRVR